MKAGIIRDIIRSRRSIFADHYIDKPIPKAIIEEVLTNATWAPNYKMTQPWRFIVLQDLQLTKFGQFMAGYYRQRLSAEVYPPARYEQLLHYPERAGCVVVIIMQRSTKVVLQEWEELAAVACAVQNMALTCTAWDIGGYWDSCEACVAYGSGLGLSANERCLGFFYMGYYDLEKYRSAKRRTGIDKKVKWLT
jgi:nitroreductase